MSERCFVAFWFEVGNLFVEHQSSFVNQVPAPLMTQVPLESNIRCGNTAPVAMHTYPNLRCTRHRQGYGRSERSTFPCATGSWATLKPHSACDLSAASGGSVGTTPPRGGLTGHIILPLYVIIATFFSLPCTPPPASIIQPLSTRPPFPTPRPPSRPFSPPRPGNHERCTFLGHSIHHLPAIIVTWAPAAPTHSEERVLRPQCLIVEG